MTRSHFDQALERLEQGLLRMGGRVVEGIHLAIESIIQQDLELAQKIIDGDDIIDQMAKDLEDECIRIIALQQPIATDLRIVTTVLKTVTDLERIADHATNIAEITQRIGKQPLIRELTVIPKMALHTETMIHSALESLVERDIEKAKATCLSDDIIDADYERLLLEITELVRQGGESERVIQALNLLFIARYLERVGDHATNIGERVIYLVTGESPHY